MKYLAQFKLDDDSPMFVEIDDKDEAYGQRVGWAFDVGKQKYDCPGRLLTHISSPPLIHFELPYQMGHYTINTVYLQVGSS